MDVVHKDVVTAKMDEIVQIGENSGHHIVMYQLTAILSFHVYCNNNLHAIYNASVSYTHLKLPTNRQV